MQTIDYGNSLLSLTASVMRYFGVSTPHGTLPAADRLLACVPRNVVVMLFDGMGMNVLEQHLARDAFLRRHLSAQIQSVFPPTTTAATTTMETGLSPIEHGWLGWNLKFSEPDAVVNLYPNTVAQSQGQKAAPYHVARRYLPFTTIFEKIEAASVNGDAVCAECISPYSAYEAKTVDALEAAVVRLCGEDGRHYLYTYHNQPDYDIHDLGTAHETVAAHVRAVNALAERLYASLGQDTLVMITADHGLTDTTWRSLYAYPEITDCLACPPSVETRAMSLFVKPGMHGRFADAFREHFGDIYTLIPHEDVMAMHLFGPGDAHPMAESFIGDFLAVARTAVSIDPAPVPDPHPFLGSHGGMTLAETEIPLIAFFGRENRVRT